MIIETRSFTICRWCADDPLPAVLEQTTAEFSFCAACKTFRNSDECDIVEVPIRADKIEEEPCDCGDRIRHNNGGHYHFTKYPVAQLPSGYFMAARGYGVALYRDIPDTKGRLRADARVGGYVSETEAIESAWHDADGHRPEYIGNPR